MDDLELLLSLQNEDDIEDPSDEFRASNSNAAAPGELGYCSDEEQVEPKELPDMSVFKDAFKQNPSLECNFSARPTTSSSKSKKVSHLPQKSHKVAEDVEVHSDLRIRNWSIGCALLNTKLADLRFVRLEALKNAVIGDSMKGAWATIGVIVEKGQPKLSSNGKNYAVWKLSSLGNSSISLFLFGDAYREYWKESLGTIITVFGATVRHANEKGEFSLSIFNVNQLTVIGESVDFGICTGKRKDGTPCSVPVNKRQGVFCKFHVSTARKKLPSKRPELRGGNLGFGPFKNRGGAHPVKQTGQAPPETVQPLKRAKHRSASELSKLLSNGDKLTTVTSSQGLKFLASLANNTGAVKPAHKKQKLEVPQMKNPEIKKPKRAPLKEVSNRKAEVLELDFEMEDGSDDAMVQAMSIFAKSASKS